MGPWVTIVLLGLAAVLYAWRLPKQAHGAAESERIVKEVESTLEQYMGEIQLENEQLLELVGGMKQEQSAKHTAQQEQIQELRQRVIETERRLAESERRLAAVEAAAADLRAGIQKPSEEEVNEAQKEPAVPSIKERYPELFRMYASGKSIDIIAKQIGMQRGEVQLIIQLAKQEVPT